MMQHILPMGRRLLGALGWLGLTVAIALAVRCAASIDFGAASHALHGANGMWLFLAAPFAFGLAFDVLAWQRLLRSLGHSVARGPLFYARLVGEALTLSLPAGAGAAESVMPALLHEKTGVSVEDLVASSAAKRCALMRAHSIYIALAGVLGFGILARYSRTILHADGLPFVVLATAALPLAASFAMSRGAGVALRLAGKIDTLRGAATNIDRSFSVIRDSLGAIPFMLGAWLMESVEVMCILHALGAHLSFVQVLSFEAGLSVVRSAAFFAPAGLGVQDLGYLRALDVYNCGDVGGAFLVIKRARETLVVLIGHTLFALATRTLRSQRGPRSRASTLAQQT